MRSGSDGDPAELGELVDDRGAAEAAEAALLDAAERHLRLVADGLVVDVDDARVDPLRELEAAVRVAGDETRREPVARRVRARDRFVRVVDDLDRRDRPERLVL